MLSRIKRSLNQTLNMTVNALSYVLQSKIVHFFIGDLPLLADPMRLEMKLGNPNKLVNGMNVVRIGRPEILGINYVMLSPKPTSESYQQLKFIMELPDESARSPYSLFNYVTDSSVFLSMNNEEGQSLRKKILAYFNPRVLDLETSEKTDQLLNEFISNGCVGPEDITKKHMRNLFAKIFLGSELDNEMHETLNKIDSGINEFLMLPEISWRFIPQIKDWKKNFNKQAEKLLRRLIKSQEEILEEKSNFRNNLLSDILREKFPTDDLNQLSDKKINELIKDPEIRLSISILLGVNNISKVMKDFLDQAIGHKPQQELLNEINSLNLEHIDSAAYRDKSRMPYLHALYLESLRYASAVPIIIRYTDKSISTCGLSIPANSVIAFDVGDQLISLNRSSNYDRPFAPERFLDSDGQLNELAKLHHNALTPFGVGKRRCPATEIVEVICKKYFLALSQNLDSTHQHGVVFNNFNTPFQYFLKKDIKSVLTESHRHYLINNNSHFNMALRINVTREFLFNNKACDAWFLNDCLLKAVGLLNKEFLVSIDVINASKQNKLLNDLVDRYLEKPNEEIRNQIYTITKLCASRQAVFYLQIPNDVNALNKLALSLIEVHNKLIKDFWAHPYADYPLDKNNNDLLNHYIKIDTEDSELLSALNSVIKSNAELLLEPRRPIPHDAHVLRVLSTTKKAKNNNNEKLGEHHATLFSVEKTLAEDKSENNLSSSLGVSIGQLGI